MALQRVWIPSPCYNGRNINSVRLIVLHTAEGARTIEDLGHFFQNYNNQVSSHVGADDKRGKIGEYVSRGSAAWTQANYNGVAVSLELCGFAAWSESEWRNNHHNMLLNCADWIREESQKLGIPITGLSDSQAQGTGRGVCQHKNLGAGGGGHVDCGSGFPMNYVLDLARGSGGTAPPSTGRLTKMAVITIPPGQGGKTDMAFPFGATKLRMVCRGEGASVKVDWLPGGGDTMTPSYENQPQWSIPNDARGAVFTRNDAGTQPISVAVG
jgi:hypothetical protein